MRASSWSQLFLGLAALVAAAPASSSAPLEARDWFDDWVPPVREYFQIAGRHAKEQKANPTKPLGKCDLDKATLPAAPTALPPPSAGLKLVHVVLGRGTQNYSCPVGNATAAPLATGAIATLYNASCTAANYPDLLAVMPKLSLQFTNPTGDKPLQPANLFYAGEHYFRDATTPAFELHQFGCAFVGKNASTPAPSDAQAGPGGKGYGAVPWLKLSAKAGGSGAKEIYRVNTAGGSPPPTCQGMSSSFTVEYAAE
ncbi:MAG: hypothetical protein M1814_004729 [Vezdaea aestivalis]|nr:MAG: hypothetical protein M1814_004729 [Vezdaea aestivalis]